MINSRSRLILWASLLGVAIAIAAIIASLGLLRPTVALFLAAGSYILACLALAFGPESEGRHLEPTNLSIEGLNLDALNLANLRRRVNKSLAIERAIHVAVISETDVHCAWQYEGSCRIDLETAMEFSLDAERSVAFSDLDCFAYDLKNDPVRLRQLRPSLIGQDGVSKKISIPFLRPLRLNDRFSVLLECNLSGCTSSGLQYYISSFSFEQSTIANATVHLIFVGNRPEWVKVYDCGEKGASFISALRAFRDDGATCEFVDMSQHIPGQSVRVYLYKMPAVKAAMQA